MTAATRTLLPPPQAGEGTHRASGSVVANVTASTKLRAHMDDLIRTFSERGDLAHVALFLWAASATAVASFALRELAAAIRRFDEFVRELSRFNDRFGGRN